MARNGYGVLGGIKPISGKKIVEPAKEFENYFIEQFFCTSDNAPEKGGSVTLRVLLRPYNQNESALIPIELPTIDMMHDVNPDNFEDAEDKALATEGAQAYSKILAWVAKKAKKIGVI